MDAGRLRLVPTGAFYQILPFLLVYGSRVMIWQEMTGAENAQDVCIVNVAP
jgi:hypothetical protein